jgi:hypothetical protein
MKIGKRILVGLDCYRPTYAYTLQPPGYVGKLVKPAHACKFFHIERVMCMALEQHGRITGSLRL